MADMADREELARYGTVRSDRSSARHLLVRQPRRRSAINSSGFPSLAAGAVRSHACRSHHVDHAGDEAEQNKHDEPPRRGRQQTVETPAKQRSDNNAGDQLRRKPETERHRRGSGRSVSAFSSGLVSPDFAAVPNFGQPVIQTSEPCGKRSFVGGRFIATSISVVVRAFRHVVETRNDAAVDGNDAPSPSKAARTILTASNQVKIV